MFAKILAAAAGTVLGALLLAGPASAIASGQYCSPNSAPKIERGVTYYCVPDGNRWRWTTASPAPTAPSSSVPGGVASTSQNTTLPQTGSNARTMAGIGGGIVLLGGLVTWIAASLHVRRRRFIA